LRLTLIRIYRGEFAGSLRGRRLFPIESGRETARALFAGRKAPRICLDGPLQNGLKYSNNARLSVASKSDGILELLPLTLKGLDHVYHGEG
jgi:hypothetical protein